MSPVLKHKNTHFSEIFASSIGYSLVSYARGGMSNGGIIIQINSAIRNNADFIILGTTMYDRIEFSCSYEKLDENKLFDVSDLVYPPGYNNYLSSATIKTNPVLVSSSLHGLLQVDKQSIWKERYTAIKLYYQYLHSEQWKRTQDRLMMYAALHKLHTSGIPYIICVDHLGANSEYPMSWISSANDISKVFHEILYKTPLVTGINDTGYHTSYDTQIELADYLIDHYNINFHKFI